VRVGGIELTQRCQVQTCSCWLTDDIEFDIKSTIYSPARRFAGQGDSRRLQGKSSPRFRGKMCLQGSTPTQNIANSTPESTGLAAYDKQKISHVYPGEVNGSVTGLPRLIVIVMRGGANGARVLW
jgi:hypothetical protein